MQLYLTDAQGYDPWVTSAPVNHLVDAPQNVDPTTWSFLDVNTDGPSVFVGLGANAGVQYSIDEQTVGQAEYRFQRGVGASTVYSGEGASLLFATEPAGDSGTQDWI